MRIAEQRNPSRWDRGRLSVVIPIGVIVAVAIVCVVVAVLTSAQRADEVSLEHEQQLFTQAITTQGERVLREIESVAESAREYEFADLKGDLDQIGQLAGGFTWGEIERASWQHAAQAGRVSLPHAGTRRIDTPDGNWVVRTVGTNVMGEAGKLAQRVADRFKFRQDVFLAEFDLDRFYSDYKYARYKRKYQPISRFPAVERDFAVVLSDGTTFAAVRDAIQSAGIPEIAAIEAVDLYRGKQMPPGKFSLLVRVTFQSQQATLTEAQVNDFSARILAKIAQQLGASLRTS